MPTTISGSIRGSEVADVEDANAQGLAPDPRADRLIETEPAPQGLVREPELPAGRLPAVCSARILELPEDGVSACKRERPFAAGAAPQGTARTPSGGEGIDERLTSHASRIGVTHRHC